MKFIKGHIEETQEECIMEATGFWIAAGGRHITSYIRVDVPDNKQYSKDIHNRFWIETED